MRGFFAAAVTLLLIVFMLATGQAQQGEDIQLREAGSEDSLKQDISPDPSDGIIATYFHGDRRCATCRKLEAYSREALETGFAEELGESTLVWRTVNYDRAENKHYLKDYGLFTKALILSRVAGGEEVGWKNLDKIWKLVGNKDNFIKYVQGETRQFIESSVSDE
jgi:hypothetical protein